MWKSGQQALSWMLQRLSANDPAAAPFVDECIPFRFAANDEGRRVLTEWSNRELLGSGTGAVRTAKQVHQDSKRRKKASVEPEIDETALSLGLEEVENWFTP